MTDHLDRKRCKNLAAWGMPQRVDAGGWVYWTGEIDEHFKGRPLLLGVDIVRIQLEHCENDWVLCPDLDELLEFAKTLSKEWTLFPSGSEWVADTEMGQWVEDTPKLAAYALIEKLQEVESV